MAGTLGKCSEEKKARSDPDISPSRAGPSGDGVTDLCGMNRNRSVGPESALGISTKPVVDNSLPGLPPEYSPRQAAAAGGRKASGGPDGDGQRSAR